MKIRIEANEQGNGCKVWLGDNTVSFPNLDDARAYIAQLEERIEAASTHSSKKREIPELKYGFRSDVWALAYQAQAVRMGQLAGHQDRVA
jgi:hypothetical protein